MKILAKHGVRRDPSIGLSTLSEKKTQILKQYSSNFDGSIFIKFGRNNQNTLEQSLYVLQFSCRFACYHVIVAQTACAVRTA